MTPNQTFQYTVTTLGRLEDVGQFEDIIVKADGARVTRLRDVAKVELGGQVYDTFFQKNGRPAAQGACPVCGTKLTRILSKADAEAAK